MIYFWRNLSPCNLKSHDKHRTNTNYDELTSIEFVSSSYRFVVNHFPRTNSDNDDGKYQYDPFTHSLSNKTSGNSGKAAFILDYDRERDFDAGVSYMFALLDSVSMWNGTGSQLASCPKQESLYFGIMDVNGVTDELAVRSSDGSLPDPITSGNNSFGEVIANLK